MYHHNRYVPSPDATPWDILAQDPARQDAAYLKQNFQTDPERNVITCQRCGKKCTKARGGDILTRSTVVCGKCYREERDGACSSVTNYRTTTKEERDGDQA